MPVFRLGTADAGFLKNIVGQNKRNLLRCCALPYQACCLRLAALYLSVSAHDTAARLIADTPEKHGSANCRPFPNSFLCLGHGEGIRCARGAVSGCLCSDGFGVFRLPASVWGQPETADAAFPFSPISLWGINGTGRWPPEKVFGAGHAACRYAAGSLKTSVSCRWG